MEIMEQDPKYLAETVKLLRKMFKLTQESLAVEANLTTRTIEKVESGRHWPSEQTLRSLARTLHMDISVFGKPTPEQERRRFLAVQRAIRKRLVVPTSPITDARDLLARIGEPHAYRFDMSAVAGDEAMEFAATMCDYADEMILIWDDLGQSDRLASAREFVALCNEMNGLGYVCLLGHHDQQIQQKNRQALVFEVALFALLPKDQATGIRYALVQLEGAWEPLEKDRVEMPDEWPRHFG